MKKKLILLVLILTATLLLYAGPVFSSRQLSYDFGQILEKDGVATHKFLFQNTGDEPLKIIDVHAS